MADGLTPEEAETMHEYFDTAEEYLEQDPFVKTARREDDPIPQSPPSSVDVDVADKNKPRAQQYELDTGEIPVEEKDFERTLEDRVGQRLSAEYDGGVHMVVVQDYENFGEEAHARIMLFYTPEAARNA